MVIPKKHLYFTRFFRYNKLKFKLYTNSYFVLRLIEKIGCLCSPNRSDSLLRIHVVKPESRIFRYRYFREKGLSRNFHKIAITTGISKIKGYNPTSNIRDIFINRDFLDPQSFLVSVKRILRLYEINNLLKKGLSLLHASAVTLNKEGILFMGTRGAGKTTIALSLVKKGFSLISDDRCFLKRENGLIHALGLDKTFKLTQKNLFLISKNQKRNYFLEIPIHRNKRYHFEIEKIFPQQWIERAPVRFLFFISKHKTKKRLIEISPTEALDMLLSQNLFYSPFKMDKKLDFFISLIKQTRQYRIYRSNLWQLIPLIKKEIIKNQGR